MQEEREFKCYMGADGGPSLEPGGKPLAEASDAEIAEAQRKHAEEEERGLVDKWVLAREQAGSDDYINQPLEYKPED